MRWAGARKSGRTGLILPLTEHCMGVSAGGVWAMAQVYRLHSTVGHYSKKRDDN